MEKTAFGAGTVPAILVGGTLGGLIGTGAGHLTGKALGKYPGQSREYGGKAGGFTGALLGAYGSHKGREPKVFKIMGEGERVSEGLKAIPLSKADKAKQWASFAGRSAKKFAPEAAAGALGAALLARKIRKRKSEGKEKNAFMPVKKFLPTPNVKYLTRAGDKAHNVHSTLTGNTDPEQQKTAQLQVNLRPDLARKINFARGTASEFGDIVSNHPVTKITGYALGKEAGIGSALKTFGGGTVKKLRGVGGGISSRARGMFIRGPKKVGLVNAAGYGGLAGAGIGAVRGAMNAEPGQSRMEAAMQGAGKGAVVGAGTGLVGRHFINKSRVKQHALKHNLPHLLKAAGQGYA